MERSGEVLRRLLPAGVILAIGVAIIVIAVQNNSSAQVMVYRAHPGSWLGVSIQDLTEQLARERDLEIEEGAFVNKVYDDSPAEEAGIRKGDVIVRFDKRDIDDADDLVRAVQRAKSGETVEVVVVREGKKVKLQAMLEKKSRPLGAVRVRPRAFRLPRLYTGCELEGMELQELNKQLGEYFGAPKGRGVLVTEVEEESPAAKAGFRAGDVIVRVEEEGVKDIEDIWDGLEDIEEGDKAKFEVVRKGQRLTLDLEVNEPEDYSLDFHFRYPEEESWSITVPEFSEEDLEHFEEHWDRYEEDLERFEKDLQDRIDEFQKKLQKKMQKLQIKLHTLKEV